MLKVSYTKIEETLFLLSQTDSIEEYNYKFRCYRLDDDCFGNNPAYPIPGQ